MPTLQDIENAAGGVISPIVQGAITNNGLNTATGTITNGVNTAEGQINAATTAAQAGQGTALQQEQQLYNTTVQNNQPYQQQGQLSLAQLQQLAGQTFDPSSVATDPGYQFGLQQGEQGGDRAAAANGSLGNGGQVKAQTRYALDYATTKYNDALNRFLATRGQNLSIAQAGINAGENANQQDLSAATTLGNQTQQNATQTGNFGLEGAQDNASLTLAQAELAAKNQAAQANNTAGVVGTVGNTIGQLLKQSQGATSTTSPATTGTGTIDQTAGTEVNSEGETVPAGSSGNETLGQSSDVGQTAAETAAGVAAPTIAAAQTAAEATPVVTTVIPGVTDAVGAGAGEAAAAGGEAATAAGEAGADAAASGGVSSGVVGSLAPLLSNPITWAVGAAIGGALIWQSTQTHQTASEFVDKYQDPFVNTKGTGQLNQVVDSFDKAYASGQMTKAQAQTAYNQTSNLINQFMNTGAKFAQGGDKNMSVWKQSVRTMAQDFGGTVNPNGMSTPDWSKILGKMQAEIAALPQ